MSRMRRHRRQVQVHKTKMKYHWTYILDQDLYVVFYYVNRTSGKVVVVFKTSDLDAAVDYCNLLNAKSNGKMN